MIRPWGDLPDTFQELLADNLSQSHSVFLSTEIFSYFFQLTQAKKTGVDSVRYFSLPLSRCPPLSLPVSICA